MKFKFSMNSTDKEITFFSTNTYSTLNKMTDKTKNIWLVFHGIGYLSRYFLKYFKELNVDENYIIAPQAPSKYYLGSKYKHVGASWLTKENTKKEIENVMSYLDAVLENEELPSEKNIIVLGYSQGVSVALRYVARRKFKCSQLVLMSGGIPTELEAQDFEFLKDKTKVSFVYGTQDEYLNEKIMDKERIRFFELFKDNAKIISFEGGHILKKELLKEFIK